MTNETLSDVVRIGAREGKGLGKTINDFFQNNQTGEILSKDSKKCQSELNSTIFAYFEAKGTKRSSAATRNFPEIRKSVSQCCEKDMNEAFAYTFGGDDFENQRPVTLSTNDYEAVSQITTFIDTYKNMNPKKVIL